MGLRRFLTEWLEVWDAFDPARAWVEAGFVEPCYRGREGYRSTGAIWDEVSGPAHRGVCACHDNKDGTVIRQEEYLDQAEALEAVGLSEDARTSS